jgi:hypothetical protein
MFCTLLFNFVNYVFLCYVYVFHLMLVLLYIYITTIPQIMIINRIYENQNLLSLYLVSFLVGLRTYQHPCTQQQTVYSLHIFVTICTNSRSLNQKYIYAVSSNDVRSWGLIVSLHFGSTYSAVFWRLVHELNSNSKHVDPAKEGPAVHRNFRNNLPVNTVWHPRTPEFSL